MLFQEPDKKLSGRKFADRITRGPFSDFFYVAASRPAQITTELMCDLLLLIGCVNRLIVYSCLPVMMDRREHDAKDRYIS